MSFSEVYPAPTSSPLLRRFAQLLEPMSDAELEALARRAHEATLAHFGRAMRMFAPIYVSNECINACRYCGFNRGNAILRVTLTVDEVRKEAEHLVGEGFRSILLVAGEHPKYASVDYLEACVRALTPLVPSVHIEVAPMPAEDYARLVRAGAEGLVIFQETYDRENYKELHPAGPKKNYAWRLETPERAYAAGFRRIGTGALFGLGPWREEAMANAAHLEHLLKHCWKAQLTTCFPRLRPAAGGFQPRYELTDRDYIQLLCAVRVCFPQVGIVVSTRETPAFRDALVPLGVTLMSAGSRVEPGGYTGQGKCGLHHTVHGRRVFDETGADADAGGQFEISDPRSAAEVAEMLRAKGYDPVWKDWDRGILLEEDGAGAAASLAR